MMVLILNYQVKMLAMDNKIPLAPVDSGNGK
jgi:hypothetical protein